MNLRRYEWTISRHMLAAFAAVLTALVCSVTGFGQCTLSGTVSTWSDSNSNWNNASHWSPAGVPNSSSTSVCITNGTSTVTLDINASVNNLQLASGNTLTTSLNTQLSVFGTQLLNNGQLVINGGGGTNSLLLLDNSMTLSGTGTLTLSTTAAGGGSAFLEQGIAGITLTNSSTIQGEGIIGNNGLTLINQAGGTINANSTGGALITTLTLQSGSFSNQGLMEATKSGVLQINNPTVNNAGGNITANAGMVQFFGGAVIQGGTLNTLNGGTLTTPSGNVATLDGSTKGALTLSAGSTYTSLLNTQTTLLGTITNKGNFQVNGGSGTNTLLLIGNNATFNGGGTVTLSTASGGGSAFIEQSVSGVTLTNADNTIQGAGIIGNNGLALSNSGTIDANVSGQTLTLNGGGGFTNKNLLEASSSGFLQVTGITVNNAGGNITANGGTVQFFGGAVIQGGTLNDSSGTLGTPASNAATLDGNSAPGTITIKGTYTSDLNTQTTVLGTIKNTGNIQLNGGSGTNSLLLMGSGVAPSETLQGGGTVTLSTTVAGGGAAFIEQSVSGITLTNVNNTIQGEGVIGNNGLTLINQVGGTINANSTGGTLTTTLTLDNGTFTNQGLMEATKSGVLQFNNPTLNNAGGNITANGGTVQFFGGAVIQGGTITNNGGTLGTPANNVTTLDGKTQGALTINGTYLSDLNTQTTLLGTINNKNNFQLNGGSGTNSLLLIGNSKAPSEILQGGGTVILSTTVAGGGAAFLEQSVGGVTLTNVNNTIQGEGVIGNNGLTLINQVGGTINANSTGGALATALTLDNGTFTNQGLMEATKSGVLQFNNPTVNNAGGNITANGGTVQFFGSAVIQGGTLNSLNGGTLTTPTGNVATLDGSTKGALTLSAGSTYTSALNTQTTILGTITNKGTLQVNGGSGTNTLLLIGVNTTLNGTGTVTLNTVPAGGGSAFIEQSVGGITLTNASNTIQGAGIIGNNGLSLVNGGTLFANSPGQTLLFDGGGTLTNNGTLNAASGSTLEVNATLTNFTNTANGTLTGGTYNASGIIQFGASGTSIATDNANIILNGTVAQLINLGGQNLLTPLSSVGAASIFSLQGGANFTTAGNFTINNTGTLTVGSGSTFKVNGNLTNIRDDDLGRHLQPHGRLEGEQRQRHHD